MGDADLGGRLPLQPAHSLQLEQRMLYDRLSAGRLGAASPFQTRTDAGELIGPFNACLYAPAIGGGFIDFHEAEERATPLSPRAREVVILSVGAVWGAAYELYAHRKLAERVGFSPEIVTALVAGEPSPGLNDEESTFQRFTLELVGERRASEATYAAAEQAVGRDGLVAAAFLAAAYSGTCLLLNAFAVPAPDPESDHAMWRGRKDLGKR